MCAVLNKTPAGTKPRYIITYKVRSKENPVYRFTDAACVHMSRTSHFTRYTSARTLINVRDVPYCIYYSDGARIRLSYTTRSHSRRFRPLRRLPFRGIFLSPPLVPAIPPATAVLRCRGRSRLYFVFHQAHIHSGAKQ